MEYEGILYRPPSEARSLIIQVTIGCAHNRCTFCNMYKEKKFRIRRMEEIMQDLEDVAGSPYASFFEKAFLADGDALVLRTAELITIMKEIHRLFPKIGRITSYGTARDVLNKSEEELRSLRQAGLEMVYLGAESGDDSILEYIQKDVTAEEIAKAGKRLKNCGIRTSVTMISGLGGRKKVKEHALACADLISRMNPDFCSFLTLRLYEGTKMYEDVLSGQFERITADEIVEELELFLKHVDSPGTIFRSNHASNYVPLAGTMNEDIPKMLSTLAYARATGSYRKFRETGDL